MTTDTMNELAPWASPDTPELAPPTRKPDAHRVQVEGVTLLVRDSGDSIFRITLVSYDTGATINDDLWLPRMYAENIKVDPTTLPSSENFVEDQKGKYATTIHNRNRTAILDRYCQFALDQGHDDFTAVQEATDTASLAEALNGVLTGVDLIVTRKARKNNPDFLNVSVRYAPTEESNPKFIARLVKGGFTIQWLVQE